MINLNYDEAVATPPLLPANEPEPAVDKPDTGITGITPVDEILDELGPFGGLVVVAGMTNVENTLLASQIASRYVNNSQRVLLISTNAEGADMRERMLASATGWSYDKLEGGRLRIMDTPSLRIPYDETENPEFTHRALPFHLQLEEHLDFHLRRDFKVDPLAVLDELLDAIQPPHCLILNELEINGLVGDLRNPVMIHIPKVAAAIMERLGHYALQHRIPVLVFRQQYPDAMSSTRKRVTAAQLGDYSSIGDSADVFIGISKLRSPAARIDVDGCYSTAQYFNVRSSGGDAQLVPVTVAHDLQRYTPRVEADPRTDKDLRVRAAEMVMRSMHSGYVMFNREVFQKLCGLGNPDCINVFAMCLLVAEKTHKHKYGTIRYGKQKIGELLGIERHRVAGAINLMVQHGILRMTGEKHGRVKVYEIVNFKKSQNPEVSGYFNLAHNLRDPGRRNLLGNPLLLRVWLGLIFTARVSPDDDILERGQLLPDFCQLAELIGEEVEGVEWAVDVLLGEGRLKLVYLPFYNTEVLEVANYNMYQLGSSYSQRPVRK